MEYHSLQPIDPRDAFRGDTARGGGDDPVGGRVPAALLLAARAVRRPTDIGGARSRAALTEPASERGAVGEEAARSLELLDRLDAAGE